VSFGEESAQNNPMDEGTMESFDAGVKERYKTML